MMSKRKARAATARYVAKAKRARKVRVNKSVRCREVYRIINAVRCGPRAGECRRHKKLAAAACHAGRTVEALRHARWVQDW